MSVTTDKDDTARSMMMMMPLEMSTLMNYRPHPPITMMDSIAEHNRRCSKYGHLGMNEFF